MQAAIMAHHSSTHGTTEIQEVERCDNFIGGIAESTTGVGGEGGALEGILKGCQGRALWDNATGYFHTPSNFGLLVGMHLGHRELSLEYFRRD